MFNQFSCESSIVKRLWNRIKRKDFWNKRAILSLAIWECSMASTTVLIGLKLKLGNMKENCSRSSDSFGIMPSWITGSKKKLSFFTSFQLHPLFKFRISNPLSGAWAMAATSAAFRVILLCSLPEMHGNHRKSVWSPVFSRWLGWCAFPTPFCKSFCS